jgi:hypothetical protein
MYIKPAPGIVIPDPDRHDMLPAEGRDVPVSDFWMRRLRDGDVVTAEAPAGGGWLPPGDDTLKEHPGTGVPMVEVKAIADGTTAILTGDHPAEPVHEGT